MKIDFYSDPNCPFCLLGKARMDAALSDFGPAEVQYHPFQLDESLPKEGVNQMERAERFFGKERLQMMLPMMIQRGKPLVNFNYFPTTLASNSFDALRLISKAQKESPGTDFAGNVKLFIMRAYHEQGKTMGDDNVLADCYEQAGGNREAALLFLKSNELVQETRADILKSRRVGFSGVPFIVVNGKHTIEGAQDVAYFKNVFEIASKETL
jgi:predicted DsbA family dithiol-disulfide isomerase